MRKFDAVILSLTPSILIVLLPTFKLLTILTSPVTRRSVVAPPTITLVPNVDIPVTLTFVNVLVPEVLIPASSRTVDFATPTKSEPSP